eukprot:1531866-Pyramimonas_sp.AAC.3
MPIPSTPMPRVPWVTPPQSAVNSLHSIVDAPPPRSLCAAYITGHGHAMLCKTTLTIKPHIRIDWFWWRL